MSAMPRVGERAPEFAATDDRGGRRTLKDLKGKWVALFFYPVEVTL